MSSHSITYVRTASRSTGGVWMVDSSRRPDIAICSVREWRGGEGEHMDVGAQLLQRFLVRHAKTLFLVHHDQPQPLELDGLGQQRMGADHHVDRAIGQPGAGFARFLFAHQP